MTRQIKSRPVYFRPYDPISYPDPSILSHGYGYGYKYYYILIRRKFREGKKYIEENLIYKPKNEVIEEIDFEIIK